jgi:signal transduction histidine kinase
MPASAPATLLPADVSALFPADELLPALLSTSISGVGLYKPIYGAGNQIVDLEFVYFNAAAQRMLGVPARPTGTYLQRYGHTLATGVFEFHVRAFESGQTEHYQVNYQGDGLDNYYYLAAQRVGQGLLVSFTDTAEHPRTAVEKALRDSQAREREARADTEVQRQQLYDLFMQAPAMICIFEGPQHVFKLVNPRYQQLVGTRPLLGKPIAEAMPELAGQPIFGLLDKVYQTGEPFYATEMLVQLDHDNSGPRELEKRYYNFIYQPTRDLDGAIAGILVFAYEVTPLVRARHLVEESEQQLLGLNLQFAAANEELERRVQERTHELEQAQAEALRQRDRLARLFMQAPAAICILDGPELVYELVNPSYQQLFPGRWLLGRPILDALPEIEGNAVYTIFRQVYEQGGTHEAQALLIPLLNPATGTLEDRYFTFIQQSRSNEQGRIDGIFVFAYEVTEQVLARQKVAQANAELQAANQQLTRINADLDSFVYTASHDLKQPVNNMAGIFEELRRSATFHDPEAAQLMTMFEGALSQIHSTVHGLAEVVQTERSYEQHPAEAVALQPLTESILQSLHAEVQACQARFELDFAAVPVVRFARLNLQSVLYNLLSNTLRYAHPERPPRVRVAAELAPDGSPVLLVQDNGLGLDVARHGNELFQMFRRFHSHIEGSGLGLYLVGRIVHQAGGRIEVDGVVNQGTTFRIFLPRAVLPQG